MKPIKLYYITSSAYKREEATLLLAKKCLSDGRLLEEIFEIEFLSNTIQENLEIDLVKLVREEARTAYTKTRLPCFVEHAGLVFDDYEAEGYPGGLTKPMWNTLGDSFISETNSSGRAATAVAIVGYCDGMDTRTFTGRTAGRIATEPRGNRAFYWDTVFIPNEHNPHALTYAELVQNHGLEAKILGASQSAKALTAFLEWRKDNEPDLWHGSN